MADTLDGYKHYTGDVAFDRYEFFYTYDNGGGQTTTDLIGVACSELVDPNDANEAKTIADSRASINKTAWLATLGPDMNTSLNGPVTL